MKTLSFGRYLRLWKGAAGPEGDIADLVMQDAALAAAEGAGEVTARLEEAGADARLLAAIEYLEAQWLERHRPERRACG